MSATDNLKQVRNELVELRRRQAQKIVNGGAVATYSAGIFNTMNWIAAVDKAIEDEGKLLAGASAGMTHIGSASERAAKPRGAARRGR